MAIDITNEISNIKLQLIINQSLYKDNIIDASVYETVQNNLLNKISSLREKLEFV